MRRVILFATMMVMAGTASAQVSRTPLPPVPAIEPLYPQARAVRFTPRPAAADPSPVYYDYAPGAQSVSAAASMTYPVPPAPVQAASAFLPPAAPPAPILAAAGSEGLTVPPNTDVLLRLDQAVSSKGKKVGDAFKLTVVQDVMQNGVVVIPRGTPAFGTIAWRTGKGMFGKSAKMEVTIDRLVLNGRDAPLSGRFRQEGQGNTGATIGTAVAAGLIAAAFVTGHSAEFEAGREFRVSTREAFTFAPPAAYGATMVTAARR